MNWWILFWGSLFKLYRRATVGLGVIWKRIKIWFDDFLFKYLLILKKRRFICPKAQNFKIKLWFELREMSQIYFRFIYVVILRKLKICYEEKIFHHEVMKLSKWNERKADQYSFIWKILFNCNFKSMSFLQYASLWPNCKARDRIIYFLYESNFTYRTG